VLESSAYSWGGAVCYTAAAKKKSCRSRSGVDSRTWRGVRPVAIALRAAARESFGTTYGIGITGIAGPVGGRRPSRSEPCISRWQDRTEKHRKLFGRSNDALQTHSTQSALDLLRLFIGVRSVPFVCMKRMNVVIDREALELARRLTGKKTYSEKINTSSRKQ